MDVTTASDLVRRVSIDQGDDTNSIDDELIARLQRELDAAEADPRCRIVMLTSTPGVFSTGMNLVAAGSTGAVVDPGGPFFDLLSRFTRTPMIIVSVVDGKVAGGGVGLVAASDLVIATPRSTFALPEALWGLLPCCVLPFLIRRIGFQTAYRMTLTTLPLAGDEAASVGLADEITDDAMASVRRVMFRAGKVDKATLGDLKRYSSSLWEITADTRRLAVAELTHLMSSPRVRDRLVAFAEHRRYPWESQ
ncbi:MAG: enoyl-CoA hydratase-related protein [Umezawaea sp.]